MDIRYPFIYLSFINGVRDMNIFIRILRYIGVLALAVAPLAIYMKHVMGITLSDDHLINFGFGMCLVFFSEIVQLRVKK